MTRRRGRQAGVTLIEMLVVVAIIGVMAGITYPSITAGLDSLRLTAAADSVAALFNDAANHAQRRQEWVEVRVSKHQLQANGPTFRRQLDLAGLTAAPEQVYFIDPLGTLPGAQMEIQGAKQRRQVRLDPLTGLAEVQRAP
ncbi:MAG: prepilin-type N-terminal cleavage/methylation domain-containing protein [Acidobacteria bacterium]|nr:prepilin-type N-terminal cleavage/methylation domain-containing protein [Acidobacteriota bacterium]